MSTVTKKTEPVSKLTKNDIQMIAQVVAAAQAAAKPAEPQIVQVDARNRNVIQKFSQQLDDAQRKEAEFIYSLNNAKESDYTYIQIPKVYKQFLGTMKICWNGAVIYLKADNKRVKIHKGFLPIINQKIAHLDDEIERMNDASDRAGVSLYQR